jgi:hypothetical protein
MSAVQDADPDGLSITDRDDGAVRWWSVKAGLVVVPQRGGHGRPAPAR